jgi:hypothetical protein
MRQTTKRALTALRVSSEAIAQELAKLAPKKTDHPTLEQLDLSVATLKAFVEAYRKLQAAGKLDTEGHATDEDLMALLPDFAIGEFTRRWHECSAAPLKLPI